MSEELTVEPVATDPVESATETNPVAEPTEPEAVEAETKTEAEPTEAELDKAEVQENHVIKRMKKFMRKAAELEEENRVLRERVNAPVTNPGPQVPTRDMFADDQSYLAAAVQYEVKRQIPTVQPVTQTVNDVKEFYKDFEDVMEDASQVFVPDSAKPAILESPYKDHLRYYLTKNPEKARALYNMSSTRVVSEIGKLEAMIENDVKAAKNRPIQVSKAKAPITPIKTQGSQVVDESKLSDAEWFRLDVQKRIAKRKT